MIIPSIDLMDGQAVQLVQGKTKVLDAGDPRPIAENFAPIGEIAVIDLDAALGRGSNQAVIKDLLSIARCRVGGGIRSVESAISWLDAGASKVILGTAAKPEILSQLPRSRTIAALDAYDGQVVVEGWQTNTGTGIVDRMRELVPHVGGFLVTFVEIEGTLGGFDPARVDPIRAACTGCELTVAGGITTPEQIGTLDAKDVDAQIGMALYRGLLDPADAISACTTSDRPDGLIPTIVVDELGIALGLAYSSRESLRAALRDRQGVYHSRTRGLWRKGESSGNKQQLLRIDLDCDRDCLRFTVRQSGVGFCHKNTATCFGEYSGLAAAQQRVIAASDGKDPQSYTARLLREPGLLESKLVEEANELAQASSAPDTALETADVLYFALVRLRQRGLTLANVARILDQRGLKLSRRPGNAKPLTSTPVTPAP